MAAVLHESSHRCATLGSRVEIEAAYDVPSLCSYIDSWHLSSLRIACLIVCMTQLCHTNISWLVHVTFHHSSDLSQSLNRSCSSSLERLNLSISAVIQDAKRHHIWPRSQQRRPHHPLLPGIRRCIYNEVWGAWSYVIPSDLEAVIGRIRVHLTDKSAVNRQQGFLPMQSAAVGQLRRRS